MSRKKDVSAEAADLAAQIPGERVLDVRVRRPADGVYEDVELRIVEMDITQIMRSRAALLPHLEEVRSAPDFIAFASDHVDLCAGVLGIATGWTAERIAALAGASFLKVAYAVMEVNVDFFLLLPGLGAFASPAKPSRANGAGETPSTSSASADTATLSATPSAGSPPPSTVRHAGNGKAAPTV